MTDNTVQKPLDLYFNASCIFSTGMILDFPNQAVDYEYSRKFKEYLDPRLKQFEIIHDTATYSVVGGVDNYSPPKANAFIDLRLKEDSREFEKIVVKLSGNRSVECRVKDLHIMLFTFNTGIINFRLEIDEEYWTDKDVLSQLRYFIQRHVHPGEVYGTDFEEIFLPTVVKLKTLFQEAAAKVKAPQLKTPFIDLKVLAADQDTVIGWAHSTLVTVMPDDIDVETQHYQDTLLLLDGENTESFVKGCRRYLYVESGDSLVAVNECDVINEDSVYDFIFDNFIIWFIISHYTWKIIWELDRILYLVINMVIQDRKKRKRSRFRNSFELNNLLNSIKLILDNHQPRNLTANYQAIGVLEMINDKWRTTEIEGSLQVKMDDLRELIAQIDEMEGARRERRMNFFLVLVGNIALSSLVLDYIDSVKFTSGLDDLTITLMMIGVIIIFTYIAYWLSKE